MSNDNSNKKFKREVSDNDFDEVLEQDWLDEEDDPSKPRGSGETEGPIVEDVADSDDDAEQKMPKIGGKFDIADLRLSEDYESAGVEKLLTTIPVGKPNHQRFFRVNPDPDYQLPVAVIELKEENETYIVLPKILPEIPEEFKNKLLVVGITNLKVLFVWPLGLPGSDGKDNNWYRSAREAANYAQKSWIRLISSRELGAYTVCRSKNDYGEPKFPDLSMSEIINIAFEGKIIDELDHPILMQLRGEV